ncbi:unnamed protein product [Arctia plantaginis]|uniref:Uncharacterized protein n=1 Tax=Arctia plantaginis TaxID=874455 RepID=A0A8S0Z141_ARCPL|nr:unnamed protein product [Arctia plantaginis]
MRNLGLVTKTRFGLPAHRFTCGICVPASCQPPSIVKLVRSMYLGTHFRAILRANITVDGCPLAGTKEEYSTAYYLFM